MCTVSVQYHCGPSGREKYTREALQEGKNVICDAPITADAPVLKELMGLAGEKGVLLFERIPLVYLRAFNQLVWHVHGGLIGKVMAVKGTISAESLPQETGPQDVEVFPVCAVLKLLGTRCRRIRTSVVEEGQARFEEILMEYDGAIAQIEVTKGVDVPNGLVIVGSEGRITVPDDWWNTGYFEARIHGTEPLKRFCFNFEGNGLRYLLQEMMIMINTHAKTRYNRLLAKDFSLAILWYSP